MSNEKIFGTDGIRGRAGSGWLSVDAVETLGRAAARVLGGSRRGKTPRAIIGHDGRRSGPELLAALGRGLAARGFEVHSAGLITTPGLALLARQGAYEVGGMVSASHNPAADNGIKLFALGGEKLSEEQERKLEELLHAGVEPASEGAGPTLDPELEKSYLTYLVQALAERLELHGTTIVVDCANGGGSRVAPRVLGRLGAQVTAIHAEPDGENINRDCGSTHPRNLQMEVRRLDADLGIALDGDGDRCLLVDERGGLVDGDGILALIARHEAGRDAWSDRRIVATVMSNKGLTRALRSVDVGLVTVDVGDRNVVEALKRERLPLGGEQSGHIIFGGDHFHIGDGIYTALRVLAVMKETGQPLSELAACYQPFPQVLVNVPVSQKPHVSEMPTVAAAVAELEAQLGEEGRVLLRYSGTEALARVMIEGPDFERIQRWAQELAELIRAEIGA